MKTHSFFTYSLSLGSFLALAVLGSTKGLLAQGGEGSHWNTIPLAMGTGRVQGMGTSVTVQKSNEVLFYSGILRQWTSIPVSANAKVSTHNAYAIVEDGNKVFGWSSRLGKIDSIAVSPSRKVLPGPLSANWVTLVQDGSKVYGFSAFRGKFTSISVGSSTPAISVGQLCAVVHDGVRAFGFGVGSGKWTVTPAVGKSMNLVTSGNVGLVMSAKTAFAFSGGRNTWSMISLASTANPTLGRGYALWINGQQVTAFSGHLGKVSSFIAKGTPTLAFGRHVAGIVDGDRVACYAATQTGFRILNMKTPILQSQSELLVISSVAEKKVIGFSGVTGRFSPALKGSFVLSLNEAVAYAKGTPFSYAYSPILDRWVRSPELLASKVTLLRNSVVETRPGGFTAFSVRSSQWAKQNASASASMVLPRRGRGSLLLITDGTSVHVWDSKLARWASVRTGTKRQIAMYRVITLVEDGVNAYGFGLFNNRWDTVSLQGPVQAIRANSSIGFIQTAKQLHVFSANGSLSRISRFPEFSRFQLRGTNLRLIQQGPGNSVAVTLLGSGAGLTRTPLGTLFLNPLLPLFVLGATPIPADARLDLSLPIPADPSLSGRALHLQNLIVPPSNLPYLTNSVVPIIS